MSYECTHHGPSLNVPAMFVELGRFRSCSGATPKLPSRRPLSDVCSRQLPKSSRFSSSRHRRNTLQPKVHSHGHSWRSCFRSHLIPNTLSQKLTQKYCVNVPQRTFEKVSLAILDWKGITSQDKPKLMSILHDCGFAN